jgi:hypothetical protein
MPATIKPLMIVVLPARPPIDKYVAYKRVSLDKGERFRLGVEFCDVNQPTDAHMSRWTSKCSPGVEPYMIDVGDKKYHRQGGSAAEVEVLSSETRSSRILKHLVELVNLNNKTGFLKEAPHSVAKIIRDAYEVMASPTTSQEVVFEHGMDVVDSYFSHQDRRAWETINEPEHAELKKLWDGFGVKDADETKDFTLPRYFRQLFMGGRSEQEIITKISWWLDKVKRITARRDAAKAKTYMPRIVRHVGEKTIGLIYVGDCFEALAASHQQVGSGKLAVGILRNKLGQVHIASSYRHKGANFDALYAELNRREPGRWYFEGRFGKGQDPKIMNASRQFTGEPPTRISDGELLQLAERLITFGNGVRQ